MVKVVCLRVPPQSTCYGRFACGATSLHNRVMNRTVRTLALAPLLLSSIHALTQPSKHVAPLTGFASRTLRLVVKDEDARAKVEGLIEAHGRLIAELSGATLGAAAVHAALAKDPKPAAAALLAALPILGAANYPRPEPKGSAESQLSAREAHQSSWMMLAPVAAALIMVLSEDKTKQVTRNAQEATR